MLKRLVKRALMPMREPPESEWQRATSWFASAMPDWASLLHRDAGQWEEARASARGPEVLLATAIGGLPQVAIIDSLLAVALTLRGARVRVLLCDTALPACFFPVTRFYPKSRVFAAEGPAGLVCRSCDRPGQDLFGALSLPIDRISALLSPDDHRQADALSREPAYGQIAATEYDGIPVGDHAYSSAVRYFASGRLDSEPHAEAIVRRYLRAAYLSLFAARRLMRRHAFDCVSSLHGIYVPHALIVEEARRRGRRVACWCPMYKKRTFVFSHHDTYHHELLVEPSADWEHLPWTPAMARELHDYLKARWYGTEDWFKFVDRPEDNVAAIAAAVGIDFSKPTVGLLTNVVWDAQVYYPSNAFASMMDWLTYTIRYFETRPDLQLLIRVHPGEITGGTPTRQPVVEELKRAMPVLPPNVFVIPPESPISTYQAMEQCDSVIIFGTKAGIELAAVGVPVIAAGEAWVRNKGISSDASTVAEYRSLLDRLPAGARLSPEVHERAQKYAYHFFFRRWIPLSVLEATNTFYRLGIDSLDDLLPGRSPGLDIICDGIMHGTPFVYPAELLSAGAPADSLDAVQAAVR